MENSPVNVNPPADQENREKGPGIHHIHGLRMKKKVLLHIRRRGRRGTGNNNNILLTKSRRNGAIVQLLKWISSCHKVFKYLIPLLSGIVAVKYEAKSEDPFKTHPLQTWSFVSAILIYGPILLASKQLKNHQDKYLEILGVVALASGVLSTLSLLSLLLPDFPGLLLLYASWALSTAIVSWPLLQSTYNWLRKGAKTLLDKLIRLARNLPTGWNSSQQESPTPQVTRPPV